MFLEVVSIDILVLIRVLLGLAGVAALIYLTIFFARLANVLMSLKKVIDVSQEPLANTLENIEAVSGNLVDMTDDLSEFLTPTLEEAGEAIQSATEVINEAAGVVTTITGVLNNVLGLVRQGTRSFESVARGVKTAANVASVAKNLRPKRAKKVRKKLRR